MTRDHFLVSAIMALLAVIFSVGKSMGHRLPIGFIISSSLGN